MPKKTLVTVVLTLPEAKALLRIARSAAEAIRADPQPVSNEVTLSRALDNVESAMRKIEMAMEAHHPSVFGNRVLTAGICM